MYKSTFSYKLEDIQLAIFVSLVLTHTHTCPASEVGNYGMVTFSPITRTSQTLTNAGQNNKLVNRNPN